MRTLFTARNGNCGKVMFSQVSVCPQGFGICMPGPFWEVVGVPHLVVVDMPGSRSQSLLRRLGMPGPWGGYAWSQVPSGGTHPLGRYTPGRHTPLLEGTPVYWKARPSPGRYTTLLEGTLEGTSQEDTGQERLI